MAQQLLRRRNSLNGQTDTASGREGASTRETWTGRKREEALKPNQEDKEQSQEKHGQEEKEKKH
jgi:hypothetical protein